MKSSASFGARIAADGDAGGLTVEDDGPGLPPEAIEVVFDIGER